MKCPIDKTDMEQGMIPDRTEQYFKMTLQWAKGIFGPFAKEARSIIAYRCTKCGKVELTTDIAEEAHTLKVKKTYLKTEKNEIF